MEKRLNRFEIIRHYDAFDELFYLESNLDVADSNIDPFFHYTHHGWREGRKPNRWFDPLYYFDRYPDILRNEIEPLAHFLRYGKEEGRLFNQAIMEDRIPTYCHQMPFGYEEFCGFYGVRSVDIILPVFNALEDLQRCMESLFQKQTYPFNLIVIDDASDEETQSYLLEASKERGFHLIRHEENRRFTHSINSGLAVSGADYVILLNSDTIVTHRWIEKIIACFESSESIGVVGVLSNAASWQSIPQRSAKEGGWMVNQLPQNYSTQSMGVLVEVSSRREYPLVPSVNGFCYSIKREVIERVGVFDTDYFPTGYGEEDDYSIRVKEAGYDIAIADDTYIYHAKSKSYTHAIREELTANGREALNQKHGKERIDRVIDEWKEEACLPQIRERITSLMYHATRNRKVLYTAIFGAYDTLKDPEYINEDWDYICFTDNRDLQSDIYTICYVEPLFESSTKSARCFKLLSHIFLIGYDYSLWIDGSVRVRGKNIDDLIEIQQKKRHYLSIHSHIKRDCIYDEAMACILGDKLAPHETLPQMRYYKKQQFPEKFGLVESAQILRDHRNLELQSLNVEWWRILDQFSVRDQLSFNYICWRDGRRYLKMEGNQWVDQYFHIHAHGMEEELEEEPLVLILFLVYRQDIEKIQESLLALIEKTDYANYQIRVIAMSDETSMIEGLEELVSSLPKVEVEVNDGVDETAVVDRYLMEFDAPYGCILRDDTKVIVSHWLKTLIQRIKYEPQAMVVGSTLLNKEYQIALSSIRIIKSTDERLEYVEQAKVGSQGRVDAVAYIGALVDLKSYQKTVGLEDRYDLKDAWILWLSRLSKKRYSIHLSSDSELLDLSKPSSSRYFYL
jgi:GT2 family glycosyltransferase